MRETAAKTNTTAVLCVAWKKNARNKRRVRILWALCFKIQKCEAYYILRHLNNNKKKTCSGFAASYPNEL